MEVVGALIGLIALVAVGCVLVALFGLLLLPLVLLLKLVGFGAKVAFSAIGWVLGGLVLLPLMVLLLPVILLVGSLVLLKLLILAVPLLFLALVVWALVTMVRRPAAA